LFGWLPAFAVLAATTGCSPPTAPGPIVIYLVDTLRPDRMSVYGAVHPTSPAAQAFAGDAVVYTNAYAVSTWTRPSVATLLTSLLPSHVAALDRWGRLDASVSYLPQELRRKEWKTAAYVANGNLFDNRLGFDRGFDVFKIIVHASPDGSVPPGTARHATAREVSAHVVKFINAQTSPQFFLYVHVIDPHWPYVPEPAYGGLFADGRPLGGIPVDYDRSVRQADDQFTTIADALREKGYWDKATVLYTSDHGEEFQEHGGTFHGTTVFDEQLRVPLIIKYPDGDGAGTRRADPVTLADVVPTLGEIYGLAASTEWIGTSLWRRRLPADRDLYFTEDLDGHRLYGLRRGSQKVIVQLYPTFTKTLFFLDKDRGEQAGTTLGCDDESQSDRTLVNALRRWREKDVAAFPSLRFPALAASCAATIDLANVPHPFLTAEDHCRWAGRIQKGRLRFPDPQGGSSGSLYVSGDVRGRLPDVVYSEGKPSCSVTTVQARLMDGPLTEEHIERLRSLGYLRAP